MKKKTSKKKAVKQVVRKGGRKPKALLHPPTTEAPPVMPDTRPKLNISTTVSPPTGEDRAETTGESAPQSPTPATPAATQEPTKPEILPPAPTGDMRLVMGAQCVWWGTMDETGTRKADRMPCCPTCGGLLTEMGEAEDIWRGVKSFEEGTYLSLNPNTPPPKPHPGYYEWFQWSKGKCYPTAKLSAQQYEKETGIRVNTER
jgi:hypothetical protein